MVGHGPSFDKCHPVPPLWFGGRTNRPGDTHRRVRFFLSALRTVSVPAPFYIFYDCRRHRCVFTAVREKVVPGWVFRLVWVGVEHILVPCRNEFQPVVPGPPNGFYATNAPNGVEETKGDGEEGGVWTIAGRVTREAKPRRTRSVAPKE